MVLLPIPWYIHKSFAEWMCCACSRPLFIIALKVQIVELWCIYVSRVTVRGDCLWLPLFKIGYLLVFILSSEIQNWFCGFQNCVVLLCYIFSAQIFVRLSNKFTTDSAVYLTRSCLFFKVTVFVKKVLFLWKRKRLMHHPWRFYIVRNPKWVVFPIQVIVSNSRNTILCWNRDADFLCFIFPLLYML